MRKSSVLAISFLALFPAAQSQAVDVEFTSSGGTSAESVMVYAGKNYDTNKERIAVSNYLSARQLEEIQKDFPAQKRSLDDLKSTIEEQKRENSNLKSSNEALSRKVDDMQRTISALERSVSDLSSKIK